MRAPILPLLTLLLPLAACTDTGDKDDEEGGTTTSESEGGDGASDGTDGGEGDGGDDGAGTDCEVQLIGHEPADGAVNISTDQDVFLQFSGPLEDAAGWTAELSPGVAHGTIIDAEDGTTLTLTTAGLLEADTVYTVNTEVCGTNASFAFTTVAGGGDEGGDDGGGGDGIDVPNDDLIGNTYSLDLATATWHEPSGLGAILGTIFQDPLLFGVTDASEEDLWVAIATTEQGSGSSGVLTVDTVTEIGQTSFADAPLLVTNPTDLTLTYSGVDIPVEGLGLSVYFAEDGSELVSARATALGDTRNVGAALGLGSGPDSLCVTLSGLGVTCVDCADGQPLCIEMDLTVDNAPLESGVSL